jgi:hypothetical protein
MVADDLRTRDTADVEFTRYISLANQAPHATCDGTLSRERQAINKTLNSLSTAEAIAIAEPVDPNETLYRIDLRNYRWDREGRYAGLNYPDAWEAVAANNPFATHFVGAHADEAARLSLNNYPVMFADSFIATATRTDVYSAILGVPNDLRVLVAQLGIERYAGAPSFRAGFTARDELIATHWQIETHPGYLWDIAAVDAAPGALFEDPLRTPAGDRAIIYSLPNGLQAFAFMGADNRRLEDSDTFLDVNVDNFRARAPLSLLREHSPRVNVRDEVLDYVRANPTLFAPDVRARISEQYLGGPELDSLLQREAETLVQTALIRAQVAVDAEPISATVDAYQRDVTLEDVAGELMMTPEALADNLALLPAPFALLRDGGMDRDDFAQLFHQALCILSIINDNRPAPELCP